MIPGTDSPIKPHITVEVRQVYGNEYIYPHDQAAHLFTELLNQRTITRDNLRIIKLLGYEVRLHQPDPLL